ncbi:MAG TPA: phosphoribosylglycinamide formyltransferase [Gemmatimonadaceae bacterium]
MSRRIAVLASGRGSNLRALHAFLSRAGAAAPGEIALVASDKPEAGALGFAREHAIPCAVVSGRADAGAEMSALLREHGVDYLVLAGYLRLVPAAVIAAFHGRVLNVHPALLPAFGGRGMYGDRVHRAVLDAGARVTGVTAHFVDEVYDRGAVIAQWPVPVYPDDTVSSLAARVLRVEHVLYPRAVAAVVAGRVRLDAAGRVEGTIAPPSPRAAFTLDDSSDADLAANIDRALDV